eukprot:7215100-Prymnesium_polylepis.1
MQAAQAAYDAVQELIARRKRVLARRRQTRKRARDTDTYEQRQRARRRSIARSVCSPEKMLAFDRVALDNSQPLHVGLLGACRKCGNVGCDCVERFVCTHCGAFLFATEAKPTKVRGRFSTKWEGGSLCCMNGKVCVKPIRRNAELEAIFADGHKRRLLLASAR